MVNASVTGKIIFALAQMSGSNHNTLCTYLIPNANGNLSNILQNSELFLFYHFPFITALRIQIKDYCNQDIMPIRNENFYND